jgi:hypothetical protein
MPYYTSMERQTDGSYRSVMTAVMINEGGKQKNVKVYGDELQTFSTREFKADTEIKKIKKDFGKISQTEFSGDPRTNILKDRGEVIKVIEMFNITFGESYISVPQIVVNLKTGSTQSNTTMSNGEDQKMLNFEAIVTKKDKVTSGDNKPDKVTKSDKLDNATSNMGDEDILKSLNK